MIAETQLQNFHDMILQLKSMYTMKLKEYKNQLFIARKGQLFSRKNRGMKEGQSTSTLNFRKLNTLTQKQNADFEFKTMEVTH